MTPRLRTKSILLSISEGLRQSHEILLYSKNRTAIHAQSQGQFILNILSKFIFMNDYALSHVEMAFVWNEYTTVAYSFHFNLFVDHARQWMPFKSRT